MEGNKGVKDMGFPLFSRLGADERVSKKPREAYENQRTGSGRGDVNSEMISIATGLSAEEIRELFD